jgi:putative ATP-dependent endonuclease of OLD family
MYRFLNYVRIFYLSAVRDSDDQFSQRSPFWGRILKDLKITPEQQEKLTKELTKLNEELLGADPRIEEVRKGLENVQKVMFGEGEASASIRALPLRAGDLLERSEVVMRGAKNALPFPIGNHGQGMQSLAVIFLFQAFIDVLLKPTFEPETEAILTLEEPEAHLHPHGARALGANLASLPVQKIISTHSPYFVQEIPFKAIRLFRRE